MCNMENKTGGLNEVAIVTSPCKFWSKAALLDHIASLSGSYCIAAENALHQNARVALGRQPRHPRNDGARLGKASRKESRGIRVLVRDSGPANRGGGVVRERIPLLQIFQILLVQLTEVDFLSSWRGRLGEDSERLCGAGHG